jgi:CheY-like chemotaxis protein
VGAKHILVVEDEEATREILRFNLASEGYEVSQAADGVEALEKARELRPDLIVLDLMLPELGGLRCVAFCVTKRARLCSS